MYTDFGKINEQSVELTIVSRHHTTAAHLFLHVDEIEMLDDEAVTGFRNVMKKCRRVLNSL